MIISITSIHEIGVVLFCFFFAVFAFTGAAIFAPFKAKYAIKSANVRRDVKNALITTIFCAAIFGALVGAAHLAKACYAPVKAEVKK